MSKEEGEGADGSWLKKTIPVSIPLSRPKLIKVFVKHSVFKNKMQPMIKPTIEVRNEKGFFLQSIENNIVFCWLIFFKMC